MKNASNVLNGYVSPKGLEFKFEQGEEILVDSFEFWSRPKNLNYIAFITNKRFIFKIATTIGRNQASIKLTNADLCFLNWNEVTGMYYEKGYLRIVGEGSKLVREFTPEGDSTGWESGKIRTGMGGLSYVDINNLEKDILSSLRKVSEENSLNFGTSNEYSQYSLIDEEKALAIKKQVDNLDKGGLFLTLGCAGSIFISIVLILLVLRACSG